MKYLLACLLFASMLVGSNQIHGQSSIVPDRHYGFLGIAVGAGTPIGGYPSLGLSSLSSGVYSSIHFSYVFTARVGVYSELLVGKNRYNQAGNNSGSWTYVGSEVGPLFIFSLTDRLTFDLRPTLGLMVMSADEIFSYDDGFSYIVYDNLPLIPLSVGGSLRYYMGQRVFLSVTTKLTSLIPTDSKFSSIYMLCNTFGVAYKF